MKLIAAMLGLFLSCTSAFAQSNDSTENGSSIIDFAGGIHTVSHSDSFGFPAGLYLKGDIETPFRVLFIYEYWKRSNGLASGGAGIGYPIQLASFDKCKMALLPGIIIEDIGNNGLTSGAVELPLRVQYSPSPGSVGFFAEAGYQAGGEFLAEEGSAYSFFVFLAGVSVPI